MTEPIIRDATTADYPQIAALRNQTAAEPVTAEILARRDTDRKEGDFVCRLVAEHDGQILGLGQIGRSLWNPPGRYLLGVWVDRDHRRQGLGSTLMRRLEAAGEEQGAWEIEALASDRDAANRPFLDVHGYMDVAHTYESVLDLKSFRPDDFSSWTGPSGVRFFSFAETDRDEEAKRKLWDLNTETSRDEPHNDPSHVPPFEEFSAGVIDAYWFDPAGQFLAESEGKWVGLSAVGEFDQGSLYNLFTGVRREFRGRGIAKALKLLATTYGQKSGASHIRTNNDSRNAPMIAINGALGYRPDPGWLIMRKTI